MRRKANLTCMVAALFWTLCVVSQARADMVTYLVNFNVYGFSLNPGGYTVPADPVIGSITVTLDPTLTYSDATSPIISYSLNIPVDSQIGVNYPPYNPPELSDMIVFGGINASVQGLEMLPTIHDDFEMVIRHFTTNPTLYIFAYTNVNTGSVDWSSETGTISVTPVSLHLPPPVPLPPTVLLLGSGLLGLAGWRRLRGTADSTL